MQNAKRYSVLPRLRRILAGNFRRGLHEPRKIRQVPPVLRCIRAHRKIFDATDTPRSFRRMTKIARCIRAFQKFFDAPDTPRTFRRVTKIARCIRALRKIPRFHVPVPLMAILKMQSLASPPITAPLT